MKIMRVLVASILALAAFNGAAAEIPAGVWQQSSSTAGDCAECTITVTKTTPQIIQYTSSNGWKGYAYYSSSEDKYKGAFQWEEADYANVVFLVQLTYEGKTLTLKAGSVPLSFSSTYRKK